MCSEIFDNICLLHLTSPFPLTEQLMLFPYVLMLTSKKEGNVPLNTVELRPLNFIQLISKLFYALS